MIKLRMNDSLMESHNVNFTFPSSWPNCLLGERLLDGVLNQVLELQRAHRLC